MSTAIDVAALRSMLDEDADVRIIDVRTPGEFESVHIPGSYNVPLDTLGEHAVELSRHLDRPVVLVCASGNRATRAERRLAEAGMANVRILRGGMGEWEAEGAPVRRGRARWGLERQVRLVAGSIVLGSVVASIWVPPLRFVAGAIGAGLTFSALSNTCGMATCLAKLPYNRSATCDVETVVAELTERAPAAA